MSTGKTSFVTSDNKESSSSDTNDVVTLHVGPSEHILLANASCLTQNSEFFKAVLKKEWTE